MKKAKGVLDRISAKDCLLDMINDRQSAHLLFGIREHEYVQKLFGKLTLADFECLFLRLRQLARADRWTGINASLFNYCFMQFIDHGCRFNLKGNFVWSYYPKKRKYYFRFTDSGIEIWIDWHNLTQESRDILNLFHEHCRV